MKNDNKNAWLLAGVIRKQRELSLENMKTFNTGSKESNFWSGQFSMAREIAFDFAYFSKMDAPERDAFLTLCGLTM